MSVVRLGVTYTELQNVEAGVRVSFTDGSEREYAAVIAADGALSKSRTALRGDAPEPRYTGQYCWRLVAARTADIDRAHIYLGGPVFAGLVPTSETDMYMWLLETRREKGRMEAAKHHEHLAQVMQPFGGTLGRLRDSLNAGSLINCRPLEAVLMPRPWYRGRLILIGDAAHSTTPHLASGAGIAVEDAVVLATLLAERGAIDDAFARFMDLRWERCRDVVETSIAIGALQQSGGSPAAYGAMIGAAEHRLRADIWSLQPASAAAAGAD